MDNKRKIEIGLLGFIAVLVVCIIILACINEKFKNYNAEIENSRDVKQQSTEVMSNAAIESDSKSDNAALQTETISEYQKDYSSLRKEAYIEALNNIHDYAMLPDESTFYCDNGEMERNEFAIMDINNDGKDELLFRSTKTFIANMAVYVFGYDENAESIYQMSKFYVTAKIYDNNYVKDLYSHPLNEMDFWPYRLYRYDEINHIYVEVGVVETSSIERNNYADYFNGAEEIDINYNYLTPQNYEQLEVK